MVNTILRRKRFKMSNCELFAGSFLKCCCRKHKRIRLVEKADHMLSRKLDVLELLKTVQRN